jgi:glutathione S-transferase
MALKASGIPFETKLLRLDLPELTKRLRKVSKSARVPVLQVDGKPIWDSLAICEYVAELKPAMWPANRMTRALARSVSAEMHSGFQALRSECPMNIRRPKRAVMLSDNATANIKRIDEIWSSCRKQHGKSGPYLFGKFSVADCMYTPVASRFETFDIKLSRTSQAYANALLDTPAYQVWKEMALKETWIVKEDEVD